MRGYSEELGRSCGTRGRDGEAASVSSEVETRNGTRASEAGREEGCGSGGGSGSRVRSREAGPEAGPEQGGGIWRRVRRRVWESGPEAGPEAGYGGGIWGRDTGAGHGAVLPDRCCLFALAEGLPDRWPIARFGGSTRWPLVGGRRVGGGARREGRGAAGAAAQSRRSAGRVGSVPWSLVPGRDAAALRSVRLLLPPRAGLGRRVVPSRLLPGARQVRAPQRGPLGPSRRAGPARPR